MVRRAWTALASVAPVMVAAIALALSGFLHPSAAGEESSAAQGPAPAIDVTVREGTSMAVSVSPDGRTLAIDLQGGIWTLPATGGQARRVTDEYNDARQPAWSPDARWIAFQGYRDGGYDIWAVAPDGSGLRKLTTGPYDDREPAWSRDGTRLAFSSDRGDGGNYNIWVLDVRTGVLQQITSHPDDEYMPTWSPDGIEVAFISDREAGLSIFATPLSTHAERRVSPVTVRADAPSWGPGGGGIIYHTTQGGGSRLEVDGRSLTGEENAFPFRAAWSSATEFFYTADGKIRKRSLSGGAAQTIEFSASLQVRPPRYAVRRRDVDSRAPRQALGIVAPVVSPDGRSVAFAALGDLWIMPVGGKPANVTKDRFLDTEPAWSPDGKRLAWASDRGGGLLNLWVRDLVAGTDRQLTRLATSAMGPAWSPDGKRIAFLDVDGIWRRANVSVVDVETGAVTRIHDPLFGPGNPTWSPDGERVAVAALRPYSTRFREGTNQILTMTAQAVDSTNRDTWHTPVPHLSIDSRVGAGPVWSPDGSKMAVVYEGMLNVIPVSASGTPVGPPRRLANELAHAPSWTADSRSVLYQSLRETRSANRSPRLDSPVPGLRLIDVETGRISDVALDLAYAPAVPRDRFVVHAARLVDGRTPTARTDMDIVIEGNRIRSVGAHSSGAHAGQRVVDASGLTVMPGLIEFHSHLQKDFGEAHNRAWLAFGITTVRSPGGTPYEAVEDREAVDAGVRVGPRIYATGYLMEWNRVYYKMAVAVSSWAHLELELERAKALRHDLIKSYVRMPDLQQRRIAEFAHAAGVPVSSHEVYPSALSGLDGTEHTTGTSRRGYSPKVGTLQRSYGDVASLFGQAHMTLTPTFALGGATLRRILDSDSAFRRDPRFALYPPWLSAQVTGQGGGGRGGAGGRGGGGRGGGGGGRGGPATVDPGGNEAGPVGDMILNVQKAGARIVAGTDTPNAANLHAELLTYVLAGMTPFEALKTATINPAQALGLDAGTIEPGKLADLVVVDGNPLQDIKATWRVKRVIANGRVFELEELLTGVAPRKAQPDGGR